MARSSALLWAAIAALAALLLVGAFYGTRLAASTAPDGARAAAAGTVSQELLPYVAPTHVCPGANALGASVPEQQRTTLCLLNYARRVERLQALATSPLLMRSAQLKADDIARCRQFSHEACGADVRQRFADAGYFSTAFPSRFGENLAWGGADAGSPRGALLGWLESPEHRANLFKAEWTEQGVALVYVPNFRGVESSRIWVSHFGRRG